MIDSILKNPAFQESLEALASEQGSSLSELNGKARKYLGELATKHDPILDMVSVEGSHFILSQAYDRTIDVHPGEIKEVARLMRRHPVAFVMTHKTYIDMLVLGTVLAKHGLPLPYIFAGINMSFMGLGQLGRKVGLIFIRRSFRNNPLYKMALRF